MNNLSKYYKREFEDYQVLVKVDPKDWTGIELIIHPDGKVEKTEMEFDEEIFENLEVDEFEPASPIEFNLHLSSTEK